YKGKGDFNQWTYEIDTWADSHGIYDGMVVEIMMDFMGGKAGQFFMKHVALRRKDWTVKFCFPPNFKLQLHEKLMSATQRHSNFRDFMCSIVDLAMRLH
ncbi:hypothetical protein K438DRAFT_1597355, partial [Mycena galopus ATCC 62051]